MNYTKHADKRAAGRSVKPVDVQAAIDWGTEIPQIRGRVALVIDQRAIKRAEKAGEDIGAHSGLIVVLADDGAVLTVIRSQDVKRLAKFGKGRRYRGPK